MSLDGGIRWVIDMAIEGESYDETMAHDASHALQQRLREVASEWDAEIPVLAITVGNPRPEDE